MQSLSQSFFRWYRLTCYSVLVCVLVSACAKQPPPGPTAPPPSPSGSEFGEGDISGLSDPGERVGSNLRDGPQSGGVLQDLYFEYDAYDLSPTGRATLQANANWLQSNPQARVEIEGHCDDRGTVEYNLALGAKRARAVRDYLISLGIQSERLSTISYGEELPLCGVESDQCWQQNRRAHFLLVN
jgi:peptidoglycan-associated lipoprotein